MRNYSDLSRLGEDTESRRKPATRLERACGTRMERDASQHDSDSDSEELRLDKDTQNKNLEFEARYAHFLCTRIQGTRLNRWSLAGRSDTLFIRSINLPSERNQYLSV